MKEGRTLQDLAVEIERQAAAKHDYIVDSRAMRMTEDAKAIVVDGAGRFAITPTARSQLATKLGIPLPYFDRLAQSHPDLLAHDVNALAVREPTRNMLRTLDGNARALLSDRYRPLDNFDLMDATLPAILSSGAQVASCEVTEAKLYIKLLMPWLDRELPIPPGLEMGKGHNFFVRRIIGSVTITNSEVGAGALAINPGIFERQCTNLAVFKDEGFGRMHVGKKAAGDDPVAKYLSDETRRLNDAAIWAQVRDVLKATMDGRVMDSIVKQLVDARGDEIKTDPVKLVEKFGKENQLTEGERGGLLKHLANSGEMTRYGLQWAVTRLAQDAESYDRASELERLGGQVIELPRNDWQRLAVAA